MAYRTTPPDARIPRDQRNFSIDSKKRSDTLGSTSNFRHSFDLPRDYDFDRVTCLLCEIPKSYYLLDEAATFQLNEATGSVDTTVSISGGRNYTSSQLESALATALTTASATGANSFTYTVAFSANTGKFTITASSGDFTLTFNTTTDANRDVAKYLGFAEGVVSASSASSVLTSLNVVDLQRYDVLYLRSDIAENAGDDLLAEIYVGSSIDLSFINWTTPDAKYHSVGLANPAPTCARFSLTDDNRKVVNLNGVNMRFVVQAFKSDRKFS